ncbi:hypothetical protein BC827DRAFT_120613 [Russula dissimulans]|nr:hypothetical protein BC827DRAFT_120613 [Russula dissimulans]
MHTWPLFRSSITPGWTSKSDSKPTLTLRPHTDISIGLSTPTRLYTPTLRAVDTHSVYSLTLALKHIAHLGRQVPSALTPVELPASWRDVHGAQRRRDRGRRERDARAGSQWWRHDRRAWTGAVGVGRRAWGWEGRAEV